MSKGLRRRFVLLESAIILLFVTACLISIEYNPAGGIQTRTGSQSPTSFLPPKNTSTPTTALRPTLTRMPCQAEEDGAGSPRIVLQRLTVAYLGRDGQYVIGSGCPGTDHKGRLEDYHLVVIGVDAGLEVTRILVTGDHSTLTWEWPCRGDWALLAENTGGGKWDIFIAPSLDSKIYTVIFFYSDNSMAMGMTATG
jgi:hypothetical protein